jgi:dihydroorotase-like cyclic amidohydrolase
VTTALEMPNTRAPTATPAALRLERERAARGTRVDYPIYSPLAQDNADQLEAFAAGGAPGARSPRSRGRSSSGCPSARSFAGA